MGRHEYFTTSQLVETLKKTKGFNVERFINGPKGPDELETEQKERETSVVIVEEAGIARTFRDSIRYSIWYGMGWHLEEQMRIRNGFVISDKPRYYAGSGTRRRGELVATTVPRELFGDDCTPGEMPQLKALLDAHGITLGPDDLDFYSLVHYPTLDVHPSSVYWGFEAHVRVTNVVIDLKKLGTPERHLPERPWPNGTVSYDLGTYIPQQWRKLSIEELEELHQAHARTGRQRWHRPHPKQIEFATAASD